MTRRQILTRARVWQHMLATQLMPADDAIIMGARVCFALWHLAGRDELHHTRYGEPGFNPGSQF